MNDFKRGGYFVEVGAHHGQQLSNTWMLEQAYDWNGLLIEPNPLLHADLRTRTAQLVAAAAWRRTGERLVFHATTDSALSSLADVKQSDKHNRSNFEKFAVDTMTLDDILTFYGAPEEIDYLSIDVEGAEIDVLDGFSIDKWRVRAITLEHNHDDKRLAEFDRRMTTAGLVRVFDIVSDFDAYYVCPEAVQAWRASLQSRAIREQVKY
jgi:FkbM family methyltransferase